MPSVVEGRGNVDLVCDEGVVGFAVLIVRELCGSDSRYGLRVFDALFHVVKGTWNICCLMSAGMVYQKGANARMCGGGSARVEDAGELGRWSQEQSSPGWATVRRKRGAEGETFAKSVPAVAEGEVGGTAEAAMAGFFAAKVLGFMVRLWLARGGEERRGKFAGCVQIWDGIGRAMVMFVLIFSFSDLYLGGKIMRIVNGGRYCG